MKTHMLLKKMLAWRIVFFALLLMFTAVATPLASFFGSQDAYAITDQQKQDCFDKFNAKDIIYANLSIGDQQLLNECRGSGDCKDAGEGATIGSRRITCTNPALEAAAKKAADAEVKPLQTLVCGPIPAGEAAQSVYIECASNVRTIYESCDNTGGGVTGSGQDTNENTSICVRNKLPNPKPTIQQVRAAVAQGRNDAQGIVDEEIKKQEEEKKKADCEAGGGTWANSTCTPKAAEEEDKPTCNVDQIGWIVCPVTTFLSTLADTSYAVIAQFLKVQPLVVNDPNNGMYKAWSIMRNFSNIAFVIAFLIIIFSQITSVGVTNYGIKKLLPKLIVAAVLVNVSYWLCAILVDISNISGSSINDLFKGIGQNLVLPDQPDTSTGEGAAGLAGAAAAIFISTGVALYVGLSALIPLAIAAAITAITVLIILVIRQVLIVLLIVVSPLAFVAFLLPNTESLFKKWRTLLTTLLVLFPLTGLVFGAAGLAGTVIMSSTNPDDNFAPMYQAVGAAIPILGLLLLIFLIKGLTGALGNIGGKALGFLNNPNKGPFDRLRKSGDAFRGYRQNVTRTNRRRRARGEGAVGELAGSIGSEGSRTRRAALWLAGSGVTADMNRKRKYTGAEAVDKSDEQSYVANRAATDEDYAKHITAPTGSTTMTKAYAIEAAEQEKKKDIAAAKTIFEHDRTAPDELERMITSGELDKDSSKKAAALQRFSELANSHGIQRMTNHLAELRSTNPNGDSEENIADFQKQAAEILERHPLKPVNLSGSQLSEMKNGQFSSGETDRVLKTFRDGKTAPGHIAKMDVDEMERWNGVLNTNPTLLDGPDVAFENVEGTLKAIQEARADPRLKEKFGPREQVQLEALEQKLKRVAQNKAMATY
jgi:hypothetical protein